MMKNKMHWRRNPQNSVFIWKHKRVRVRSNKQRIPTKNWDVKCIASTYTASISLQNWWKMYEIKSQWTQSTTYELQQPSTPSQHTVRWCPRPQPITNFKSLSYFPSSCNLFSIYSNATQSTFPILRCNFHFDEFSVHTQVSFQFYCRLFTDMAKAAANGTVIPEHNMSLHPYFNFDVQRNVTARVGQTAFLQCKVEQLGDKSVSFQFFFCHFNIHIFPREIKASDCFHFLHDHIKWVKFTLPQ